MGLETVAVTARASQVQLTFPDGRMITTASSILERSPVLRGALQIDSENTRSTFSAPIGYTIAWLSHIHPCGECVESHERSVSLVTCLKAADYFADEQAATELSAHVGLLLLPSSGSGSNQMFQLTSTHTGSAFSPKDCSVYQISRDQVLQELPDHLLVSVVQAADFSLLQSLTLLPASHHHLALCALFPDITRHHSLRLTEPLMASQRPAALLTQDACAKLDVRILRPLFKALHRLRSLRELHIWTHERTAVPDSDVRGFHTALMQLPELTSLTLEGGLVPVAINELSEALGCCLKLQSVSLRMFRSARPLMPPPDTTGRPHVKLSSLFEALKKCTRLESLSLKGLNTGACVRPGEWAGCVSMAAALSRLSSLTLAQACINADQLACVVQELHGCKDSTDDSVSSVSVLKNLCHLNMREAGTFGNEGSCALRALLESLPSLQHLDVSSISIMDKGALTIAPVFKSLPMLTHLDMSGNLMVSAMPALGHALMGLDDLRFLSLSANGNPKWIGDVFGGMVGHFTALTHLNLKGCALGCPVQLAQSLLQVTRLSSLRLDADSLGVLAPSVACQKQLLVLELNEMTGPSEGMSRIIQSITELQQLQSLELTAPAFATQVATDSFSAAFRVLTNLQLLRLRLVLPDPLSVPVCAALSNLACLSSLTMDLCGLSAAPVSTMSDSVKRMPHLSVLSLRFNKIGDQGAKAVADSVRVLPRLQVIDLSDCEITAVGAAAVLIAADEQGVVERCALQGNGLHRSQLPRLQRQLHILLDCGLAHLV